MPVSDLNALAEADPHPAVAPNQPGQIPNQRRFTLPVTVAIFSLFLLMGVMLASMGAALPWLRTQFHDPAGLDVLVSLYSLGALVTIVASTVLRRWLKPSSLIAAGQITLAIGYTGMAFAPLWSIYLGSAIVAGLGAGILLVYLNAAVARGFGAHAVVAVSVINAGFGIGAVLGPVIIGGLGGSGIRIVAGVAAVLVAGCFLAPRAGQVLHQPQLPAATSRVATTDTTTRWLIVLIAFWYAGVEMGVGAWETTYLTWRGFTADRAAWYLAAFWGGLALGRLVLPPLLARRAPHRAITSYLAAGIALLVLAAVPAVAPLAFIAVGVAFGPVLPTTIAWLSQATDQPETANSYLFTATITGNVVIPALIAMIATPTWPLAIPLTLALGCLFCLVVTGMAGRRAGALL